VLLYVSKVGGYNFMQSKHAGISARAFVSKVGGYMQSKHAGMRHSIRVLKQALFIADTCIDCIRYWSR